MKKFWSKILSGAVVLSIAVSSASFNVYAAQVTQAFVTGWSKFISHEPDATANIVTLPDGNHAVKITSNTSYDGTRFMRVFQNVKLEKDMTYIYGMKVKAENVAGAEITFFGNKSSLVPFSKNSDWTNYEFQNTYTGNTGNQTFNISVVDTAKAFYADDVYLYKCVNGKKTGENLLSNAGFEDDVKNAVNDVSDAASDVETADLTIVDTEKFLETSKSIPIFRTEKDVKSADEIDWTDFEKVNITDAYFTNKEVSAVNNESYVKYAYDNDNFYIYFNVKDDVHHSFLNSSYWSGDSVQVAFAPERNTFKLEVGASFDAETGEVYCTNEDVSAKGVRNGEISEYFLTVPWIAFTSAMPEKFQFSAIVNDNDNDVYQRKYAQQISPGIASAKNAEQFPMLYLAENFKSGYFSTIEGGNEVFVSQKSPFMLVLQSFLNDYGQYFVTFPNGKTVKVDLPPLGCAKVRFDNTFANVGLQTFDVSVKKQGAESADTVSYEVTVIPDYAMYLKLYDKCNANYEELKSLVEKCREKDIPVDYETADLTIFEMYLKYMKEDADKYQAFDRILYSYDCLNDIFAHDKENLQKYLSGEKTAYAVPKYVNSDIEKTATGFIADMDINGTVERRPMFLNGFCNFVQGEEEYAEFAKLGANMNMLSLKLYDVITEWCEVPDWNLYQRTKTAVDRTVTVSGESVKNGKYALKLERTTPWGNGRTIYLRQSVPCKPNTTYKFGLSAKGEYIDGMYFACHKLISSNYGLSQRKENYIKTSSNWVDYSDTYTTSADDNTLEFIITLQAPAQKCYIDDIYIKEEGSDKNLLKNGDFEKGLDTDVKEYDYYDGYLREFECRLKEFEQANQKVGILLAANYWPEFVNLKYPDVLDENVLYGEYLKFNTAHPEVKKILHEYVAATMNIVNKSKVVDSVCVANEPCTYAYNTQYYKPMWYEYIKNIYGDIENLNRICGTDYEKFEDVDMKSQSEFTVLYKNVMEFNAGVLADYLGTLCGYVKEFNPDMPTHAKLLPITLDYGRSALTKGENYEKLAPYFDYNGNDANTAYNHQKQSLLAKLEWYDLQSSIKDAPVVNTEDHFQMDSKTIDKSPKMYKHAMADAWQGVMHNRAESILWVLEREEQYLTGTTWMNTNLAVRADLLSGHVKAFLDFNRLSYEITAVQNAKRSAAILYSENSYSFKPSFQSSLLSAYSNVLFNGLKPLLLVESQLEKLDNYNLLIIPECTNVTDETFSAIEKFVNRGGKLVIIGEDSLYKDEFNAERDKDAVLNIYKNAVIIKTDVNSKKDITTAVNLPETISEVIGSMNLTNVKITDKATGENINRTEWICVPYDGGYLLNMCRYVWGDAKDVEITVDGKKIEKFYDLRENEYLDGITLEEYTPLFVKIEG